MKLAQSALLAVTGLVALGGLSPAMARRDDRRSDTYSYVRDIGDAYLNWDRTRRVEDVVDLLYLDRGQRDKIHELVGKYNDRIHDIARNDRLRPSERQDRIWDAQKELRGRVIHVLTRQQRERLDYMMRSRSDRSDRYDRRDRSDRDSRW